MHYHLEIIMPPVDDVEEAVKQIMEPFSEYAKPDEDGYIDTRYSFWDWYVIGGRWAGSKMEAQLDKEKIKIFYDKLKEKNITVSGVVCGKQKIEPESHIPIVDALWLELFPESKSKHCPIFSHSNDQYAKNSGFPDDVMLFSEVPMDMTASSVIFAEKHWKHEDKLEAKFMVETSVYNGVSFIKTVWDGTLKHAVEMYLNSIKSYKEEYREKYTPKDDWLVVTVDYHS